MRRRLPKWRKETKKVWEEKAATNQAMLGAQSEDYDPQLSSELHMIEKTKHKSSGFTADKTHNDDSSSLDCAAGNGRVTNAILKRKFKKNDILE